MTRNPWADKVLRFYKEVGDNWSRVKHEPTMLEEDVFKFRHGFMQEELDEFKESFENEDFTGMCDAIADLLYVVIGTGIEMGVEIDPIFDEVHRSNMTKKNGYKREDGKWMKPDDWEPPELEPIIQSQKSLRRNNRRV